MPSFTTTKALLTSYSQVYGGVFARALRVTVLSGSITLDWACLQLDPVDGLMAKSGTHWSPWTKPYLVKTLAQVVFLSRTSVMPASYAGIFGPTYTTSDPGSDTYTLDDIIAAGKVQMQKAQNGFSGTGWWAFDFNDRNNATYQNQSYEVRTDALWWGYRQTPHPFYNASATVSFAQIYCMLNDGGTAAFRQFGGDAYAALDRDDSWGGNYEYQAGDSYGVSWLPVPYTFQYVSGVQNLGQDDGVTGALYASAATGHVNGTGIPNLPGTAISATGQSPQYLSGGTYGPMDSGIANLPASNLIIWVDNPFGQPGGPIAGAPNDRFYNNAPLTAYSYADRSWVARVGPFYRYIQMPMFRYLVQEWVRSPDAIVLDVYLRQRQRDDGLGNSVIRAKGRRSRQRSLRQRSYR